MFDPVVQMGIRLGGGGGELVGLRLYGSRGGWRSVVHVSERDIRSVTVRSDAGREGGCRVMWRSRVAHGVTGGIN